MNGEQTQVEHKSTEGTNVPAQGSLQAANYEDRRLAFLRSQPTYQRDEAMQLVRQAARLLAEPEQRVIYRDAFRWKNDADDSVLPNHYEMFSLRGLAAEFGFEVIHDFNHVAVVKP